MSHSRTTLTLEQEHLETIAFPVESRGENLSETLIRHGFPLNTRCGQRGLCKGCEAHLVEGTVTTSEGEITAPAVIRTCAAKAKGSIRLFLPNRSRIEHKPQVGETFEIAVPCGHDPLFPVLAEKDTAFAVDIGTTTVVVMLIDLNSGATLSRAGSFNAQIRFGDNVLTRIDAARSSETLRSMQSAIVRETLSPLLAEACQKAGKSMETIAGGTIAANTTMLHLLLGMDPTPLGIAPFTPRFLEGKSLTCGEIGLTPDALAPDTPLQLLPGVAAYIGADITAGIYATGMAYDSQPSLLVDIGTNGEIVLQHKGALTACATAAGPAFEGCGLRSGTRAKEGAISDISINGQPFNLNLGTIGNVAPQLATGICGSAYVDFLAEARAKDWLTTTGRFSPSWWNSLPDQHRLETDDERAVVLCGTKRADAPKISEVDIALLLQAKAAIGAGIETLLETAGIRAEDICKVHLAGGFGMHLNVSNAIAIGLLPGFTPEQIHVVGNTSLAGALLATIDRSTLEEMESIRKTTRVIELNLDPDFENLYIDHLMLP